MSATRNDSLWRGCHGVRLEGAPVAVGSSSGEPLATATVSFGKVEPVDGTVLWTQHGEAHSGEEHRVVDRVLLRVPDGRFLLTGSHPPLVDVDVRARHITIGPDDDAVHQQLVAAFAVPLVLNDVGALMVHGSACALGDETILVCGASGSGKSSTLIRLVGAGWLAVSEDICAIDLAAPEPVVWPGPPWVRVRRGEPGPPGCPVLFDRLDKTAWDISHVQTKEPTRLSRIVLLDSPGGSAPVLQQVVAAEAIRALARHVVWLQEQDQRARQLFAPIAALATRVPTFRMRLPRHDHWSENLPDLLASSVLIS